MIMKDTTTMTMTITVMPITVPLNQPLKML